MALLEAGSRKKEPEPFPWGDQAVQAFTAAAAGLGGAKVVLAAVGPVDRKTGAIDPQPMPWLSTAGAELAAGLNLLAAGIPMPEPAIVQEALQHFEAARAALAAG
ncbi:hypothetical protein Dvina_31905 [Dactylosporangium vinaceum]|uniref:Uncharacterized protein n=1 Tax=Dactylosporangium vinaceum TaxID=53362 RepID=A0ABV5MAQ3_9ACTN|nr:hypothetical protein [Dactylosporangium vinaceum]UAB92901.1 hypothetical protein Dvina_31905 [Dactylosporangium vinaceum]